MYLFTSNLQPLTTPELWTTPVPSESPDMEFIIVRESDEEDEVKSITPEPPKSVKSAKSAKSLKSAKSAKSEVSTAPSEAKSVRLMLYPV